MAASNQPSPELKKYQSDCEDQYDGICQCDDAIEFFEKQRHEFHEKLKKFGDDLDVSDDAIAELEAHRGECEQLALAFEEEAHGRERQIVYLLDAMIDVVDESAPAGVRPGASSQSRNLETSKGQHERLAHQRRERVKKREDQLAKLDDQTKALLNNRRRRREADARRAAASEAGAAAGAGGARPVALKGKLRVEPVRAFRRKPFKIDAKPIRRRPAIKPPV